MTTHVRSHRRKPHPHTTLDPDEQSELALKIRYGIGLDQLVGAAAAAEIRQLGMTRRDTRSPTPAPVPREPDAGTHARAAALGIGAGRRGQWLRRQPDLVRKRAISMASRSVRPASDSRSLTAYETGRIVLSR